jgi:AcrR family transcriptional regulator
MSLRSAKRAATERQIRTAARDLFLERGFRMTSMEDIAGAAGVSRATLFNYFPGKDALLRSLAGALELRLVLAVSHYRRKAPSAPAALEALFARAADVLDQTADLTRLIVLESGTEQGFPALLAAFVDLAKDGQASGQWRTDVDAVLLGESVYLSFVACLLSWCRRPQLTLGEEFVARCRGLNRLCAPAD